MSARGARSRKAVVKDIEKKEKKAASKAYLDSMPRPNTAFSDWGTGGSHSGESQKGSVTKSNPAQSSSRKNITSGVSQATSRSSASQVGARGRANTGEKRESAEFSTLYRPQTSNSTSTSLSGSSSSTAQKNKAKYQAKGKETKAPRGRGGGVPVKSSSSTPVPPPRSESSASYIPPIPRKSWSNFKVWHGGDIGLRPYGGFEFDEDMQQGSVLIYFKEEQDTDDKSVPQLRADLAVLEESGSTWLSNSLLYGKVDDYDDDDFTVLGSPELAPQMMIPGLHTRENLATPPPFNFDEAYIPPGLQRAMSRNQFSRNQNYPPEAPSIRPSPSPFPIIPKEQAASHELWFTAPAHVRAPQAQRLHHVAVRNFLALLHHKPIVGTDLFEMLSTLQPEIEVMYDLDHNEQSQISSRTRSVQMITHYLISRGLDDPRRGIKHALGLLAWAEQDTVKWQQGYLESFVHLAGVMSPKIEELPDFKRLSVVTRRNLGVAANALQLKTIEAEEKLATFDFSDMWGDNPDKAAANPVYKSFVAFRQFLVNCYSTMYGSWPPNQGRTWLNRKVAMGLQQDFGSLYDYLVNRDVVWDSREERPGKKWQMEDRSVVPGEPVATDTEDLPLTDMLIGFDNRHGLLHIPHPYPLLPRTVTSSRITTAKKGFFSGLKKSKGDANQDAKTHLQLSIVFSDATNIQNLGASFTGSPLIDAFERYELNADLKGVSPRDARLGRWILLYGILQVLSRLAVDTGDLKFTDGVQYFLSADLKRCPYWVTNDDAADIEASQLRSWCWQRSWDSSASRRRNRIVSELEGSNTGLYRRKTQKHELSSESPSRTNLDLDREIERIGSKIDQLGRRDDYGRTSEYEKMNGFDFGDATPSPYDRDRELYRSKELGFVRPQVPVRSSLRSPDSDKSYRQAGYFGGTVY